MTANHWSCCQGGRDPSLVGKQKTVRFTRSKMVVLLLYRADGMDFSLYDANKFYALSYLYSSFTVSFKINVGCHSQ